MKTIVENQNIKGFISIKKVAIFGAYTSMLGFIVGVVYASSIGF